VFRYDGLFWRLDPKRTDPALRIRLRPRPRDLIHQRSSDVTLNFPITQMFGSFCPLPRRDRYRMCSQQGRAASSAMVAREESRFHQVGSMSGSARSAALPIDPIDTAVLFPAIAGTTKEQSRRVRRSVMDRALSVGNVTARMSV
jgi:hypothetical protein